MNYEDSKTRCIEGRVFRHDPKPDDPYLETDIGQCYKCDGKSCEKEDKTVNG